MRKYCFIHYQKEIGENNASLTLVPECDGVQKIARFLFKSLIVVALPTYISFKLFTPQQI